MAQSIIEESKQARRNIFLKLLFSKRFVVIAVAAVLVASSGYYYFYIRNAQKTVAVQQKQATVKKGDLKIAIESEGSVVARDGVELSFSVSGDTLEVANVYAKEGDKIKKGDKIASVKTKTLEFELRNAYASYQSALASYNDKVGGATDLEISKARNSIAQAQASLDQAKLSLEQTESNAKQDIANAENAIITAKNNLKLNQDEKNSQIVNDAYTSLLSNIKSISVSGESILNSSDKIVGVDNKYINDDFESVLGVKNINSLSTAQGSYSTAKSAKDKLDDALLKLTDSSNHDGIMEAAQQADTFLKLLEDHLYDMQIMLTATITSSELSQTTLDSYKSTVNSDRSSVNTKITSLNSAIEAVADAKRSLTNYEIAYNKAVSDSESTKAQTERDIANAKSSVKLKEASWQEAKDDYADLVAPISASDLASAKSQLTSAAVSLDRAKYNLEQATLTSPIDGTISQLNYKAGDIILADNTEPMAIIVNNETLFIEVNIEEADINKVKVGDKADITFDAIDGLDLEGEVSFISLKSSTNSNSIVTYLVRVMFTNTDKQVKEGMTAAVDFITAEAKDVLYIPVSAVRNINGKPSVEKKDGTIAEVTTNFTDGTYVEIVSGLNEGDVVVY